MFIDKVKILVKAGDGGNGCLSFRREKYVPKGGPDGGNGGDGGSVVLRGSASMATLIDFKYRPHFKGGRGEHGLGKNMYGRASENLVINVPLGTVVRDFDTGETVCDIMKDG
jgi:GTPase